MASGWRGRPAAELGVAESTAIYLYGLELDVRGPDDPLSVVERVLYLTAAMTGMRQGELLALRWMDVDSLRAPGTERLPESCY